MTQEWVTILIILLFVICCGGMTFGMRGMGGKHKSNPSDADQMRDHRPPQGREDRR